MKVLLLLKLKMEVPGTRDNISMYGLKEKRKKTMAHQHYLSNEEWCCFMKFCILFKNKITVILNIYTFYLLQCEKGKEIFPNIISVLVRFYFNYNFILSQNSNISLKAHFFSFICRRMEKRRFYFLRHASHFLLNKCLRSSYSNSFNQQVHFWMSFKLLSLFYHS